ncbi:MAG: pentapeptide repeat-containing protein [Cellulosilyticaceae bacterium]
MENTNKGNKPQGNKGKSFGNKKANHAPKNGQKSGPKSGPKKTAPSKKVETGFNYKNTEKMNKNFMYKDLRRSHCYDCDFSGSNFDFTSFRGAHFKSCNFYGGSFRAAEFVGSNLKKSRFKKARFEDVIFEGANLDGVDFQGATFKNTIFVGTDVTKAKNLNTISVNIKIYDAMPELEMSEALQVAIQELMENKYVKNARVLDTKEGTINTLSMMRLLEQFDEAQLIKGFGILKDKIANDFCTLSYIIKFLANSEAEGLL